MPLPGPGQHRAGLKLRYWGQTYSQLQLNSFQRQDQKGSRNFQQNEMYKFYSSVKKIGFAHAYSSLRDPLTMNLLWNQLQITRCYINNEKIIFKISPGLVLFQLGSSSLNNKQSLSVSLTTTEPIISRTRTHHEIIVDFNIYQVFPQYKTGP